MSDARFLGTVRDVDGATLSVRVDPNVPTGLMFADGEAQTPGQVGGFVRVSVGFLSLIAVVTRAGSGAVPNADLEESDGRWLTAQLVGESAPGLPFARGVARLPGVGAKVFVLTESDLRRVYGAGDESNGLFSIGQVAAAPSVSARIDLNRLVTRHSAIVGSTGSGKSTTVAKIAEVISEHEQLASARAVLFDLHGEYARALGEQANVFAPTPEIDASALFVPFWALSFDELLRLAFGNLSDEAGMAYVRDEVVRLKRSALASFPRPGVTENDVTPDTPIPFSLRQLWFDLHVLLNATHSAAGTGQSIATIAFELDAAGNPIEKGDPAKLIPPRFAPQNLAAAATKKVYLSASPLNIRRHVDILASRLRDPRLAFVFSPGDWDPALNGDIGEDLDVLLRAWLGSERKVTVLNLSGVPPLAVDEVVGSMTRVIYDSMFWARQMSEGARERPLLMIFEEAHSYLGHTASGSAKASVQRIVREGRKYGLGAMIVSQRPSEIDPTILSQCGTLISMRLTNATDRQIIARSAADNLEGMFAMLPILRTGEALLVGESVPLPTRAMIAQPTSPPDSLDPILVGSEVRPGGWDKKREMEDYRLVVQAWRAQTPDSPKVIEEN